MRLVEYGRRSVKLPAEGSPVVGPVECETDQDGFDAQDPVRALPGTPVAQSEALAGVSDVPQVFRKFGWWLMRTLHERRSDSPRP